MKSYKDPSFQDRTDRAAQAKQKALNNLRQKPPVDEKLAAERQAARLSREAAEAEKRAAKKAAEQAAKEAKAQASAAKAQASAAAKAERETKDSARAAPRTEAEMKLARDARYAARKSRK